MSTKVPYRLLASYFSGNCNESEKLRIEKWKAVSNLNEQIFLEYREIWEHSSNIKPDFSPDVDGALQKIDRHLNLDRSIRLGRTTGFLNVTKRIAAVILVAAGLGLGYYLIRIKYSPASFVEITTQKGDMKEVVLPDQSHVWLNSQSRLRYEEKFERKERKVFFEGEAFFEIAKNPSRPFIIETLNSITKVLGTAFNLRARKGETKVMVTVSDGKVTFSGKEMPKSLTLFRGDKGILDNEKSQLECIKNDDVNFLAWKTGILIFRNTPLGQVASKLTYYYGKNVMVEDATKADIPFTSTFDHQPFHDVISIIEMSLGVKADTIKGIIVFR